MRIALLSGLLCVVGCAGPRVEIPSRAAIVPPERWLTTSTTAMMPGEEEWLQSFSDPVLSRLVQTALSENLDLSVSAQKILEARAQFRLARSQEGVSLGAGVGGGRERDINPGFGFAEKQSAGEAELNAAYDADLFGRLANATKAARASVLASEAAHETVRIALLSSVVTGYIGLRALDARLELLTTTARAREEEWRFAERRVRAGYAPSIDAEQAEAAYQAALQLLSPTKLAIARQEHGLSVLLGDIPRAIARGPSFLDLQAPAVAVVMPSMLLRRRPDIREAEWKLVTADRSLDSARAAFMPSVEISASGGWVVSTLIEHNPSAVFSAGGSILAPIFESGRLTAQRDAAVARRDEAAFAYKRAVLGAFRDVEDALSAAQYYREQENSLDQQAAALSQVFLRASRRYRAGYSPYLEQIDAERNLLSAQLSVLQSRLDWLTSLVNLYQAVGGGAVP
jgi:outer membrane protein, multidrug efflux system